MWIHKLLASKDASKKKAHGNTSKQKIKQKRGEEKANLFENRFRSGGEENESRMANNVMREMRVYDGYLVCLGWCRSPRQWHQKSFLLPLELALIFPLKRKG